MGIIIRQSLKSTVVSISGALVGAVLLILVLPKVLPIEFIGNLNFIFRNAQFFTDFFLFMATNMYLIFIKKYEKDTKLLTAFHNYLFKWPLLLFIITSFVFVLFKKYVIAFFVNNENEIFKDFFSKYFHFFIILIFVLMMYSVVQAILNSRHKNTLSAIVKDITPRAWVIITIGIYLMHLITLNQFTYFYLCQYLLGVLIGIYFLKKFKIFPINITSHLKKEEIKLLNKYRSSHFIFIIIYLFILTSPTWVLGKFFTNGSALNGAFMIAMTMANFMYIPYTQLANSSISTISEDLRQNNIPKLKDIYQRSSINLFIISSYIFIAAIIFMPLLSDYLGLKFEKVQIYFPMLLLYVMIDTSSGFSQEIIYSSKYNRALIYISFISFMILVLSYIVFIHFFSDLGIGISLIVWSLSYQIIKIIFVYKKWKILPYKLSNFIQLLLLFIFSAIFFIYVSFEIKIIWLKLLWLLLFSGLYFFLLLKLNISVDLNNIIKTSMNRITKKQK